jgi:hypothetical protein
LLAYRKIPMKPLAEDMWNGFNKHNTKEWLAALAVKRENLEKWAQAEIADGRAIKRFQEREARKGAK